MVRTSKARHSDGDDESIVTYRAIDTEHQAPPPSDNAAHTGPADSPSLIKELKKAAKTAAKKSRRVQRALLAAPDDPVRIAAAKTAADVAAKALAAFDACRGGGAGEMPKGGPKGRTFSCVDVTSGVDLAQGLTLHYDAISAEMEAELVAWVLKECERGRSGELRKPTYLRAEGARSQGNRREAIMCGCSCRANFASLR